MKYLLLTLFICLVLIVQAQRSIQINLANPPQSASLFGEGSISTFINERDFAISPDGKEIYFTISTPRSSVQAIVTCTRIKDDEWTSPEIVSFSGEYSDLEPTFSNDGNTLYFASNRPISGSGPKDFDLWKVTRTGLTWSTPQNLSNVINTTSDEFYPSVAKNGNLYFTASYPNGVGKEDIFVSAFVNGKYEKPVALDTAVNSAYYEFNAFVSPDEQYILFSSFGRADDTGRGDLYISVKGKDQKWKKAVNLKQLNSPFLDYCPYVSPDGKTLFFTSEKNQLPVSFSSKASYHTIVQSAMSALNGTGNIYWVDFSKLLSTFK